MLREGCRMLCNVVLIEFAMIKADSRLIGLWSRSVTALRSRTRTRAWLLVADYLLLLLYVHELFHAKKPAVWNSPSFSSIVDGGGVLDLEFVWLTTRVEDHARDGTVLINRSAISANIFRFSISEMMNRDLIDIGRQFIQRVWSISSLMLSAAKFFISLNSWDDFFSPRTRSFNNDVSVSVSLGDTLGDNLFQDFIFVGCWWYANYVGDLLQRVRIQSSENNVVFHVITADFRYTELSFN